MMPNEELSQTLDQLHQLLAQHPQLDATTLKSLKSLLDEIETACRDAERNVATDNALDDDENREAVVATDPSQSSLNQRLQDVISDFEVRHPRLTATLSQIADRLSEIGI